MDKVYLVLVGRVPGIYTDWNVCKSQVSGFANAVYCKCNDIDEALAAQSHFEGDSEWCSKNPLYICPSCQQHIKCEISNSRETIGSHYYCCKTVGCKYFTWVANLRQHKIPAVRGTVGSSSSSSASCNSSSKCEALEAELRVVPEERDIAIEKCVTYKYLIKEIVNLKLKEK